MKRFILAVALCFTAVTSYAFDVGVHAGHGFDKAYTNLVGVSVSQKLSGPLGVQVSYDHNYTDKAKQERYNLMATYDLLTISGAKFVAKGGGAMLDNKAKVDGFAWQAGLGAEFPITKKLALTADYRYQFGQKRVASTDGGTFLGGIKVSF